MSRPHLAPVQIFLLSLLFAASQAFAGTGGGPSMPWDGPLDNLVENLAGPVTHAALIAVIVITGLMWMFTEHSQGVKWLTKLVFGGACAAEGINIITTLGISGALVS